MAMCRRFDSSLTSDDTKEFTFQLMNCPGFLPDCYRDYKRLMERYTAVMSTCCEPWAMVDSKGKLGGVFFIGDVVFGSKATLFCWLWNPKVYTAKTKRFLGEYIEYVAESNRLDRIECRTPDKKLLGMLERMGFKMEGRFARGYRCGGRSHVLYQARRLFQFGGA